MHNESPGYSIHEIIGSMKSEFSCCIHVSHDGNHTRISRYIPAVLAIISTFPIDDIHNITSRILWKNIVNYYYSWDQIVIFDSTILLLNIVN